MPGTFIFKPLQADLNEEKSLLGNRNPYCTVKIGDQKVEGQICKDSGNHPQWNDAIILQKSNETICTLALKDKCTFLPDGTIGSCEVSLDEIQSKGKLRKWYDLKYKDLIAGQILIEVIYTIE